MNNTIIPLHPLQWQISRDSLKAGISFEKSKHLIDSGYKQFGLLIGEKYRTMALIFHVEPPSSFPTPHIVGGPWVYFLPYVKLKRHRFGANVEIVVDGAIPVPPSRGYLSCQELTWGKPIEELFPITILGELALIPDDKETRSKVYSYIFRPGGYLAVRPPVPDDYDSAQWKIYRELVVPVLTSRSDIIPKNKKLAVSIEDKAHFYVGFFRELGRKEISEKIERFRQESSSEEMGIMLANFCGKLELEERSKIPDEFLVGTE